MALQHGGHSTDTAASQAARRRRLRLLAQRAAARARAAEQSRAAEVSSRAAGQGRRETAAHGRETHRGGAKLARKISLGQALLASVAKGSKVVDGRVVRIQPPKGRSPLEGILSKNAQTSGISSAGGALAALSEVGGLSKRATEQIGQSIIYSPAGVYEAGKATGLDVRDIATGRDFTPGRTAALAKAIGTQLKEDVRHPGRNIGYLMMDAFAAASAGAGATSRLSAAGRAAGAAKGAGRARAALTRAPAEGGSLLRPPRPGTVRLAEGADVRLSKNALVRSFQRRQVKGMQKRPESKVGGYVPGRNLPERVGFERRRRQQVLEDVERAPAEALQKRAKKLSAVEQTAIRIVAERVPVAERIAKHEADLAKVKGPRPTSVLARKRLQEKIDLLKEVERGKLIETVDGVPRPSQRLREVYELSRRSGGRREAIIEELGLSSKEELAARRAAPGRVFEGAEFKETRAKSARVAQTREYQQPAKTTTRPRTAEEAQTRLEALDKEYEGYVKGAEARLAGGAKIDPVEVGRRNIENRRRIRGRVKQAKLPTHKQELRTAAEAELFRVAEKHPDEPAMQRFLELDRERVNLRELLNDPERAFGPKPDTPYRGQHGAPSTETARMDNVVGDVYPDDFYDLKTQVRYYGTGDNALDRATLSIVNRMRGKPDASVTIFRAVPKNVAEIHAGDWVTPLKRYAEQHAAGEEGWHVIERKVSARELFTQGDSIHEWGWHPKEAEFGSISETVPGKTIRRELPAQERVAAARRLVGAEGKEPGELFVSYGRRRNMPTGRARLGSSQGVGIPKGNLLHGQFTGKSIETARFRDDAVRAVAEGELEAQRFRSVLNARELAVKDSIDADAFARLPEKERKHYIPVRVTGKPYSADTREFVDSIQRKLDSDEKLNRQERRTLADRLEKTRGFFFPKMDVDEALAAAAKGEVRMVDRRLLGGLNEAQSPTGRIGKALGTIADEINAAETIAILFLKPAYLTPNLIGQAALATIQQGWAAPWNLTKAVQVYRALSPEDRAAGRAAIGQGLAQGLKVERARLARPLRDKLANAYGKILDSPSRWPAFIHEARVAGYKTPEDIHRLLTDQKLRDDLVDVSLRTRDAMIDYHRLGTNEQMIVRRLIFFYPWVKGSGLFTGRFLRDHPIQAATTAQLGRFGAEKTKRDLGPVPYYARGTFKVGTDKQGRPLVVNPRAAQLFDSPVQAAQLIAGILSGKTPNVKLGDMLSPAAATVSQVLSPHDPLIGYQLPSIQEGLKRQLVENLPQVRLATELRSADEDQSDRLYPTSRGTALRKFGIGTISPRPVNLDVLNQRAREEAERDIGSPQRAYRKIQRERQAFFVAARTHLPDSLENGRLPQSLRTAFTRKAAREAARAELEAREGNPTQHDRYETDVKLLRSWGLVTPAEVAEAMKWAQTARESEIEKQRGRWSAKNGYFGQAYLVPINFARKALEAKGAELPIP